MTEFAPNLRRLAHRLSIPEPARSRVLLEVAADMEALFRHLLEQGVGTEEARSIVSEQFDLSNEALLELSGIHGSTIGRSLDGLSTQARSTWERVVLGLVAVFVILSLLAILLFQPTLLRDASPLVYGLLALTGLGSAIGTWRAVGLFRRMPEPGPVPRQALRALPGLSVVMLLTGLGGTWVELYRVALGIRATPSTAFPRIAGWLHLASATLVVSLSGALLMGLLWFFLENRAAYLDERAAAQILELGEATA